MEFLNSIKKNTSSAVSVSESKHRSFFEMDQQKKIKPISKIQNYAKAKVQKNL